MGIIFCIRSIYKKLSLLYCRWSVSLYCRWKSITVCSEQTKLALIGHNQKMPVNVWILVVLTCVSRVNNNTLIFPFPNAFHSIVPANNHFHLCYVGHVCAWEFFVCNCWDKCLYIVQMNTVVLYDANNFKSFIIIFLTVTAKLNHNWTGLCLQNTL